MEETLEEAAEIQDYTLGVEYCAFIEGAKWQQERQDIFAIDFLKFTENSYSYGNIADKWYLHSDTSKEFTTEELLKIYKKQFKKK